MRPKDFLLNQRLSMLPDDDKNGIGCLKALRYARWRSFELRQKDKETKKPVPKNCENLRDYNRYYNGNTRKNSLPDYCTSDAYDGGLHGSGYSLSPYMIMLALLNIPRIGFKRRNKYEYPAFAEVFDDNGNVFHKGTAGILKDKEAMEPIFRGIIKEVNRFLKQEEKQFLVPEDIHRERCINVSDLYMRIEETMFQVDTEHFVLPMPEVETPFEIKGLYKAIDEIEDDKNVPAIEAGIENLLHSTQQYRPKMLPPFGQNSLFVVGESDIVAKHYIDRCLEKLKKASKRHLYIIEADVTHSPTETVFLRRCIKEISKIMSQKNSKDWPPLDKVKLEGSSLSALKEDLIRRLRSFSPNEYDVLFYLNSRQMGAEPQSHEYAAHLDRSFIETLLDDISFRVTNEGDRVKVYALYAVKGIFRGYHSLASKKVALSPVPKHAWIAYAEENANAGRHGQKVATKVIKHIPVSELNSSIVSSLVSLDAFVNFQEVTREIILFDIINKKIHEEYPVEFVLRLEQHERQEVLSKPSRNNRHKESYDGYAIPAQKGVKTDEGNTIEKYSGALKYFTLPDGIQTSDELSRNILKTFDDRFFWREQLTSAVFNHRCPIRFAKLILFYLGTQRCLDYYFLLVAIAVTDNGLRKPSMLFISNELGLGLERNDIDQFVDMCNPLLLTIDDPAVGAERKNYEKESEYELISEVRKSIVLHSHSYLDNVEYKEQVEAILSINTFNKGKAPARIIPRQHIHFVVAKLSCTLYMNFVTYGEELPSDELREKVDEGKSKEKTHVQTLVKKRRRTKFYVIAIKHFLKAVGPRGVNVEFEREYQSYHWYLHNLPDMKYESTKPTTLINFSWKLFINGIEQQDEEEIIEGFDNIMATNDANLLAEIIRMFCSISYPHRTRFFHINQPLATALDDGSFLHFLNSSAVTYYSLCQSRNFENVYSAYHDRFARYQRFSAKEVIGRYLEGNPVALLSRESMSRVNMLHVRTLLDQAYLYRAKNFINELITDLGALRRECLERLALLLKVTRIHEGKDEWEKSLSEGATANHQNMLLKAMRRILKKDLRYQASMLLISTATGNMASALRRFVTIFAIIENPVEYLLRDFEQQGLEKDNLKAMLTAYQDSLALVLRNRVLHHCIYYLFINDIYGSTAKEMLLVDRLTLTNDKSHETSMIDPYSEISFYNYMTNRSVVKVDTVYAKSKNKDSVSVISKKLLGVHVKNTWTFETLKTKTLDSLKKYLVVQKLYLEARDQFLDDGTKDVQKQQMEIREKHPLHAPKSEDFFLILSLANNANRAGLLENYINKEKTRAKSVEEPESSLSQVLNDSNNTMERLLESTTLRYTKQVHLRAGLERYRENLLVNQSSSGVSIKGYDAEKEWLKWLESEFRGSQNTMALLELLLLKAYHHKQIIRYEGRENTGSIEKNQNQTLAEITAICQKNKIKLRELDIALLHTYDGKSKPEDRLGGVPLSPLSIR